jgi:hypothetical protein
MKGVQMSSLSRALRLALGVTYLLVVVAVGSAGAATKPYSVSIGPSTVPGGSTNVPITATLTNNAQAGQQLGSADLIWPSSILQVTNATVTTPAGTATLSATCASTKSLCVDISSSCTLTTSTGGTVTGPCVEARNLAIPTTSGKNSGTITMYATTQDPCTQSGSWFTEAKQANNFSGTGNDLDVSPPPPTTTVQGACGLRFESTNQPTDALVNTPISNSAYTPEPSGGPVKVDVLNSSGNVLTSYNGPVSMALNTPNDPLTNPTPSTLGGTTTVNATSGVASFGNLTVNSPGNGYTLTATGPNSSTAVSNGFDIHQSGTPCNQNQANCSTDKANGGTSSSAPESIDGSVQLASTGPFTILSESLDFGSWPAATQAAECSGYSATHWVYLNVTTERFFTSTITTTASLNDNVAALIPQQQACFTSDHPFTEQVYGTSGWTTQPAPAVAQPDGSPGYAGLLPTCDNAVQNFGFPTVNHTTSPCVNNRSGLATGLTGGTLTVAITSPFDANWGG